MSASRTIGQSCERIRKARRKYTNPDKQKLDKLEDSGLVRIKDDFPMEYVLKRFIWVLIGCALVGGLYLVGLAG